MKHLALSLLLVCAAFAAESPVTEPFVQTYPLTAKGAILLENVSGLVEIEAWDKNEVSLDAVKSAPTAEDLARVHIKVENTAERISITTDYDKKWYLVGSWRGEVRYKLRVPAAASLQKISVMNGDIRVREVKGPVFLKTLNGKIDATGVATAGRFETINGPITVGYAQVTGVDTISLRSVNGDCELTLPKGSAYALQSKSVNGGVRTDASLKIEKTGLGTFNGTAGEGGPKINFDSVNGGLVIHERQ